MLIMDASNFTLSVAYAEFFWEYWYMYQDRNFNKSIEEQTFSQSDRLRLWLYLAAFRYQTTRQGYEITRQEGWTFIKLIKVEKVKKNDEVYGAHTDSVV